MTYLDAYKALLGKAHRAKIRATALRKDGDLDGHAAWLSAAKGYKADAKKALAAHKAEKFGKAAA